MGEVSQTKVCPLCAETIKAQAKLCPYCQTHQGRFTLWREQLGQILAALLLLALLGLACFWAFPDVPASGRNFARHRDELRVLRPALERAKKRREFWLAGYVTNAGNFPWRVHKLELRFLDAKGNLLDVRHAALSDTFVVSPLGEAAFHVRLGELVFTNSDVVHQVRVQAATDGNLPPNCD